MVGTVKRSQELSLVSTFSRRADSSFQPDPKFTKSDLGATVNSGHTYNNYTIIVYNGSQNLYLPTHPAFVQQIVPPTNRFPTQQYSPPMTRRPPFQHIVQCKKTISPDNWGGIPDSAFAEMDTVF